MMEKVNRENDSRMSKSCPPRGWKCFILESLFLVTLFRVAHGLLESDRGQMAGFRKSLRQLVRSLNLGGRKGGREEAPSKATVRAAAPGLSRASQHGSRLPDFMLF